MQFFKYEGFIANLEWTEENNDRRIMHERTRKIMSRSNLCNRVFNNNLYFYLADTSNDTATIGIICNDTNNLYKHIDTFLKAIEIELKDTTLEEITFNSAKALLRSACRNDYIKDEDEVLEQFDLDKLSGRHGRELEFGENIIGDVTNKSTYSKAKSFLARDSFVPELDRIFAGDKNKKALGHPVHYMIQTDDPETRKEMFRLLIGALYHNGRLQSKRYTFLDIKPGEYFPITIYNCLYNSSIGGTVVVRYLDGNETEDDYATCSRETIEQLCKVMKKYHNKVLTIFCLPRECTKSKEIFYENLGNISFVELKEEFVFGDAAKNFLKIIAKENGVRTDKKLFAKLECDKGYLAPELHEIFDEWYNNKLKNEIFPQYKEIVSVKKELTKATPKGSAYEELKEMIGLDEVKKVIYQALDYSKAQKLFADKGMQTEKTSMHMVFTGNPGTAKTSVARLFARIMKENGILSKGNIVEVGRGDLVGKFVGWTAPTIQKKFREAEGGVLFIDEAYSLVDDRSGSFGDEAINTIVQEMENHRSDVVVIFAGYPDKMEQFLQKNPGLRSRIAFHVPFVDYNTEELCSIANLIATKKGLTLSDEASEKLSKIFDVVRIESDFGNGRYVRNAIEKAKMAQATRLLSMDYDSVTKKDICTICADDIEISVKSHNRDIKKIGFSA